MTIAKGFDTVPAFKINTLAGGWGSAGHPVATNGAAVCGAGDGIEILSEGLTADSQLIENEAVSGSAQQLPGTKGNELHAGPISLDAYYQGLDVLIACVFGTAGVPTLLGSSVYKHVLKIADNHEGRIGTLVLDNLVAVREWPHVKVAGVTFDWQEGAQGKVTFNLVPHSLNLNVGSPVANRIVTSVEPANVTYTIANQPAEPSPISITITDANASITEHVITITGTDRDGNVIVEVYTLSVHGLTWVSTNYFETVISVVGTGLAGTATGDTLVVGVTNGKNNATTVASITLPAQRDFVLFSQLEFLVNLQAGGALAAADEQYLSAFRLSIDLQATKDDVTTRFGNKIDEPVKDGFVKVTGGINFSKWTTENHPLFKAQLKKSKHKAKATFTGPVAGGSFPFSWTFYLNNVQFRNGSPNVGGAQRVPFDLEFMAGRALSLPTGFPSGYLDAVTMEAQNLRSSDPLA